VTTAIGVPVATVWTAPDAPRSLDGPAVADEPDVATWVRGLGTEARLGLHGRILTQALLGEPVEVLALHGGWAQVVLPEQPSAQDHRGYPGWVRRAHISSAPVPGDSDVVVACPVAIATTSAGPLPLSFGTRLPIAGSHSERVTVALPGGGKAALATRDVAPCRSTSGTNGAELVATAGRFLGLRYLWGGMCAWSLDCSGLVHLVHRALGHRVPRDADDQQAAAMPIPVPEARAGDLYFLAAPGKPAHHVGFVTNEVAAPLTMLHAPETGQHVVDASIPDDRQATLIAAGSFLRDRGR